MKKIVITFSVLAVSANVLFSLLVTARPPDLTGQIIGLAFYSCLFIVITVWGTVDDTIKKLLFKKPTGTPVTLILLSAILTIIAYKFYPHKEIGLAVLSILSLVIGAIVSGFIAAMVVIVAKERKVGLFKEFEILFFEFMMETARSFLKENSRPKKK